MSKAEALRVARQTMVSGYQHHSYTFNRQIMDAAIKGGKTAEDFGIDLGTYADVLAPTKLRGMKNGLICLITVVSRSAISNGVENELGFALSDYYINAVELQNTEGQLNKLLREIIEHYLELVQEAQNHAYSLPVTRAIRYINLHIYDSCRVSEVAEGVNLNSQYFSALFKKETGLSPSVYISKKRLEESRYLLLQTDMSITEIAETLGYCNPSHFIREYRREFSCTPKQHIWSNHN